MKSLAFSKHLLALEHPKSPNIPLKINSQACFYLRLLEIKVVFISPIKYTESKIA